MSEGDAPGLVDFVVSDPPVRVSAVGCGLGSGGVGVGGGAVVEGPMGSVVVVALGELIQLGLQTAKGA